MCIFISTFPVADVSLEKRRRNKRRLAEIKVEEEVETKEEEVGDTETEDEHAEVEVRARRQKASAVEEMKVESENVLNKDAPVEEDQPTVEESVVESAAADTTEKESTRADDTEEDEENDVLRPRIIPPIVDTDTDIDDVCVSETKRVKYDPVKRPSTWGLDDALTLPLTLNLETDSFLYKGILRAAGKHIARVSQGFVIPFFAPSSGIAAPPNSLDLCSQPTPGNLSQTELETAMYATLGCRRRVFLDVSFAPKKFSQVNPSPALSHSCGDFESAVNSDTLHWKFAEPVDSLVECRATIAAVKNCLIAGEQRKRGMKRSREKCESIDFRKIAERENLQSEGLPLETPLTSLDGDSAVIGGSARKSYRIRLAAIRAERIKPVFVPEDSAYLVVWSVNGILFKEYFFGEVSSNRFL